MLSVGRRLLLGTVLQGEVLSLSRWHTELKETDQVTDIGNGRITEYLNKEKVKSCQVWVSPMHTVLSGTEVSHWKCQG